MALVQVKKNETFEIAFRRFRRNVERSGVVAEVRERAMFEKPAEKRKRKKLLAVRRTRRALLKRSIPKRLY